MHVINITLAAYKDVLFTHFRSLHSDASPVLGL